MPRTRAQVLVVALHTYKCNAVGAHLCSVCACWLIHPTLMIHGRDFHRFPFDTQDLVIEFSTTQRQPDKIVVLPSGEHCTLCLV
jgi:hypothetical protein